MPETQVKAPDGTLVTVKHPEGATDSQILSFAKQSFGQESFGESVYGSALQREKKIQETKAIAEAKDAPAASIIPQIGEGVAFAGDVVFDALGRTAKAVAPQTTEKVSRFAGDVAEFVADTPVAKFASKEYQEFYNKHPLLAENIEGSLGIMTFGVPILKGAQASRSVIETGKKTLKEASKDALPTEQFFVNVLNRDQRALDNILKHSEQSTEQLLEQLKDSDILTIADIAGDEVQSLTRSLGKMEGAKNVIADALAQRSDSAVNRVTNALSKNISNVDTYFANIDDIQKTRAAMAKPLYKKAYSEATNITNKRLDTLLLEPRMTTALEKAINEYGIPPEINMRSLQALDGVKKALYDMESEARRQGKNILASDFGGLRRELVGILDQASPSYSKARKVYETNSQLINAQESGRIFDRLQPEELRRSIKDMLPHEKEAFKIGVRQKLQEITNKTADGADPAKRIFGNTQRKKQLEAVFGKGKNYDEFAKKMREEMTAMKTKQAVLGGSRTDINMASDLDFIDIAAQGSRQGVLSTAIDKTLMAMTRAIKRQYTGISNKNARKIAEILTDRDKGIKALEELIEKQNDIQQRGIIVHVTKEHAPAIMTE